MDRLKKLEDILIDAVHEEMSDLEKVDAKELGEVIDMIKDIEEAMYYCSIVEAMEEAQENRHGYTPYLNYIDPYLKGRDVEWKKGKMYYGERGHMPMEIHDSREGKSPMSRRGYMEAKEMHKDKHTQMQELEKYMQELSDDIIEMIMDATPDEKAVLQQKLSTLASKIK